MISGGAYADRRAEDIGRLPGFIESRGRNFFGNTSC